MPVKSSTLQKLVRSYGKTMKEFIVEDMGMTEPAYYRALKRNSIRIKYIQNAAKALNVDIHEIYDFGEEDDTTYEEPQHDYKPQNMDNMDKQTFKRILDLLEKQLEEKDRQIRELILKIPDVSNQSTGTTG